MKRGAWLLTIMLIISISSAAFAEKAEEPVDYAAAYEAYEFSAVQFEPILLMEYSAREGEYDVKAFLTGLDEGNIYVRLENAGKKAVSFSFSQFMLDDLAFYRYHDWSVGCNQTKYEIIEIPKNALRWAGRKAVSEVSLSTPAFNAGGNPLYGQDLAAAKIAETEEISALPEGMEILSGTWGSLRLIGIDGSGGDMEVVFRLDNALPSWTKEWARGVTFYSYMSASVHVNSVNGIPVEGQVHMSQNWVCSSIDSACLEFFQMDERIEEITMSINLMGGGEDDYYNETVELTVRPDYEKLIMIGAAKEE